MYGRSDAAGTDGEEVPDDAADDTPAGRDGVVVDRYRVGAVGLSLVAAVVALVVAGEVFPYRSLNHDEAVYLQQAAMLLEGQLYLRPPVEDAFRPWFFVESERGLYSKYAPVPAAVFALGKLLGGYRLALAGVAAAIVGLTAGLGRELYDGRTGLLAGVLVLASPLFLVHAGVFLPYATTTAFNLAFALAYLRAERLGSRLAATVAGAAIGVAFFARPYTAVLFAAPFVVHAVWTLATDRGWRVLTDAGVDDAVRSLVARRVRTAALGSLGVAVALGYNWLVTGDPLLFPYQAFAPEDGIGFGHRQILGHEADYDLALALRSNAQVLRRLFADWVVAGWLGTALAAVGVLDVVRTRVRVDGPAATRPATRRTLLAGLFVSVPLGNLAFWGNFNVLGNLDVRTDGLIHYLGPYYHYDLLVPTAVFGAAGAWVLVHRVRGVAAARLSGPATGLRDGDTAGRVVAAVVLVAAASFGGVAATAAADPLDRNAAVSDELRTNYEPFLEAEPPDDAVVFLPTVYGPWLNHPFQLLRNDPGFDGERVYALGDVHELRVAAAFPDRALYRYVHVGSWVPVDGSSVDAELRRVERASGEAVGVDAAVGVPERARAVTVRVGTDAGSATFVTNGTPGRLAFRLSVADGRVTVSGERLVATGDRSVPLTERDEVVVEVFVRTGTSAGFTYRLTFPVATDGDAVRALSPTREWCRVPTRCVPAGLGDSGDDVFVEAELVASGDD